jgi:glycerophosphoryl diester phosphodiesterase
LALKGDEMMRKPMIIAHRGASAYAPENTMVSFKRALEMGAEGIELDVHLTADGYMAVIHDGKVDRTSSGKGWVKDMTLSQLRELDFGSWFSPEFKGERIPVLEDIMELLKNRNVLLNIEAKSGPIIYHGLEEKLSKIIHDYGMTDRVIVSSFNHYSLVHLKSISPDIKIGLLYEAGLYEPWDYAKKLDAYAIHPLFYNAVPEIVEGCRKHGVAVNPFTVDQPELIRKVAAAGVDGIITNVPDIALKVVNGYEVNKNEA